MRVTIVNPPQGIATGRKPNIDSRPYFFPPGLLYLAGAVERAGFETEILDFPLLEWDLSDFERWVSREEPDVLGLTFCSPSLPYARVLAETTRTHSPGTRIVVGGPHATFAPDACLQEGWTEYVVRYEGEISFPNLIREIERGRQASETLGVSYRHDGKVIHNANTPFVEDLNSLGIPAYHLIDMARYKEILDRSPMCAMRGCPYTCNFCTIPKLMGSYRARAPQIVAEEMQHVAETYGMRRFSFTDPTFTLNTKRLEHMRDAIQALKLDVKFGIQTRVDTLSDSILDLLGDMGCVAIFFGIESGSREVLSSYTKNYKVNVIAELAKVRDKGFDIIPSFMIGSPEESAEDIDATIDLAQTIIQELGLRDQGNSAGGNYQINVYGPFPGVKAPFPLELSIEYAPVIPLSGTRSMAREEVREKWHRVWEIFFPDFFQAYLDIEAAAENGRNLLLEKFVEGSAYHKRQMGALQIGRC